MDRQVDTAREAEARLRRAEAQAAEKEATNRVHDSAVHRLEEALVEQDRLGMCFDAAVGTSTEFAAYARLQGAGENVAARQAWLSWVENESDRGLNADPLELAATRI